MSFAWYRYYAFQIGVSRRETAAMRFGELLDLIACYQIKHEGARLRAASEEDEFWALLDYT